MTEKYYFRCDEINAWSVHETGGEVIIFDLFKSDAEIVCNKLNEQDKEIRTLSNQLSIADDTIKDLLNEIKQLKIEMDVMKNQSDVEYMMNSMLRRGLE